MELLLTNDDGYRAKGIRELADIASSFGKVTVLAPKTVQSGMSMAVNLGAGLLFSKDLGGGWHYFDASPATCVKLALNSVFREKYPDVVLSGINHGSNASTAACYSGTLGAAEEAALNGILGIGISLDSLSPDADFSGVRAFLPQILEHIFSLMPAPKGVYYNINFPDLPPEKIRGIRSATMGMGRWTKELERADIPANEEGEVAWKLHGEYLRDADSRSDADDSLLEEGWISVSAHNLNTTDLGEVQRLRASGLDREFGKR